MAGADSSAFGHHDNPLYRKVTPSQQVWVNLAAAHPLSTERERYVPRGWTWWLACPVGYTSGR